MMKDICKVLNADLESVLNGEYDSFANIDYDEKLYWVRICRHDVLSAYVPTNNTNIKLEVIYTLYFGRDENCLTKIAEFRFFDGEPKKYIINQMSQIILHWISKTRIKKPKEKKCEFKYLDEDEARINKASENLGMKFEPRDDHATCTISYNDIYEQVEKDVHCFGIDFYKVEQRFVEDYIYGAKSEITFSFAKEGDLPIVKVRINGEYVFNYNYDVWPEKAVAEHVANLIFNMIYPGKNRFEIDLKNMTNQYIELSNRYQTLLKMKNDLMDQLSKKDKANDKPAWDSKLEYDIESFIFYGYRHVIDNSYEPYFYDVGGKMFKLVRTPLFGNIILSYYDTCYKKFIPIARTDGNRYDCFEINKLSKKLKEFFKDELKKAKGQY